MLTKWLSRFLWFYIIAMFLVGCHIYGIVVNANGDNVEHLHTSWLVWQGKIPYKDFFQHHNPLTWYLSAPFVAALINNPHIFAIFNILGVFMLYLIAYYHYKIFLLDQNDKISALFVAAVTVSSYSLLWSTDYRPDTFMFVCFFIGLYYLFKFDKTSSQKSLNISFLAFFFGFMFTQKILMHLIVPAMLVIYWLMIKKITVKQFMKAIIAPLIGLSLFLLWLHHHQMIELYWRSNFIFNQYIPKIFEKQRIVYPPTEYIEYYIFIPIAAIATLYFLFKGNILERTYSLMFIVEACFKLFYFSAFLHYIIFWLMLSIMLTFMLINKLPKGKEACYGLLCLYLLFMVFYNYHTTYAVEAKNRLSKTGHEYAFNVLTPCDYAINGYYATYNLKAKDAGYYSILLGQIDVLGEKVGVAPKDNLNELVRTKLPKLVSAGVFWNTYWEQRGKSIPVHQIDSALINTYYDYTGLGDLHILKPQYQKHYCVYNGKEWKYMD